MIIFLGIVFLSAGICSAQPVQIPQLKFSPKNYICYRTETVINVDGKLNEPVWTHAEWTDDFVDIEGPVKPLPRFRTRAKMLWDENYFYFAAELEEPHIWGTLKNRDDIIFYDNDFEIFIDPDGNTHNYCEFEMNALNTIWDLLLIQPYRDIDKAAVHGWDIKGLKSGTMVYGTINNPEDEDSCWTVEVAFPWEAFREITNSAVPPAYNDQWRINFSRVEWKTEIQDGKYRKLINPETNKSFPEDNWVWSPQGVVNMHYPEMWGYVQFSGENVRDGNTVFLHNKEEEVKWFLRQIYYRERIYFDKTGKFTNDLNKLGIELKPVPGFIMPPEIECTKDMFKVSVLAEDNSKKIQIRHDGLVWSSPIAKSSAH